MNYQMTYIPTKWVREYWVLQRCWNCPIKNPIQSQKIALLKAMSSYAILDPIWYLILSNPLVLILGFCPLASTLQVVINGVWLLNVTRKRYKFPS